MSRSVNNSLVSTPTIPTADKAPGQAQTQEKQPGEMSVKRSQVQSLVIAGGTGSQGAAFAYAAAASRKAGHHEAQIYVPVRDLENRTDVHSITVKDEPKNATFKLGELGVQFIDYKSVADLQPQSTIVLATVSSQALASVLLQLPEPFRAEGAEGQGLQALVATYNGTPSPLPQGLREPQHAASRVMTGAVPGRKVDFTFKPGAGVQVSSASRVAADLAMLFGAEIKVNAVANSELNIQWGKIAANAAHNSLAAIFGLTLAELGQRFANDADFAKLGRAIAAEVWLVARQSGATMPFESLADIVLKPPAVPFRTSTGNAIQTHMPITEDIDVYSQGVARVGAGKTPGVATPVCDALTGALKAIDDKRGKGTQNTPLREGFYAEPGVVDVSKTLLSPVLLEKADTSIAKALAAEALATAAAVPAAASAAGAATLTTTTAAATLTVTATATTTTTTLTPSVPATPPQ